MKNIFFVMSLNRNKKKNIFKNSFYSYYNIMNI